MPADSIARQIGIARVALGMGLLAAPAAVARLAGIDTGTARRVTWLTRMTAGRDLALGAGTLAARGGGDAARWLAVGAAADLADAVILTSALRQGRLGRVRGVGMAAIAAGGAVVGTVAALRLRRG
jgi:hypothetical protein